MTHIVVVAVMCVIASVSVTAAGVAVVFGWRARLDRIETETAAHQKRWEEVAEKEIQDAQAGRWERQARENWQRAAGEVAESFTEASEEIKNRKGYRHGE